MLACLLNLGFAASEAAAVVVVAETATGGAGKKRRRGYPRWILIGDRRYRADSPEDERRMLAAYLAEQRAKLSALEEAPSSQKAVKSARVRVVRTERRLAKVDTRADEWHAKLRQEDEEILLLH